MDKFLLDSTITHTAGRSFVVNRHLDFDFLALMQNDEINVGNLVGHRVHLKILEDAVVGRAIDDDIDTVKFVRVDQVAESKFRDLKGAGLFAVSVQHAWDFFRLTSGSCRRLAGFARFGFERDDFHDFFTVVCFVVYQESKRVEIDSSV